MPSRRRRCWRRWPTAISFGQEPGLGCCGAVPGAQHGPQKQKAVAALEHESDEFEGTRIGAWFVRLRRAGPHPPLACREGPDRRGDSAEEKTVRTGPRAGLGTHAPEIRTSPRGCPRVGIRVRALLIDSFVLILGYVVVSVLGAALHGIPIAGPVLLGSWVLLALLYEPVLVS